jgi:hypothetical protein
MRSGGVSGGSLMVASVILAVILAAVFLMPEKLGLSQSPYWDKVGQSCPPGRAGFSCSYQDMQRGGGRDRDPRDDGRYDRQREEPRSREWPDPRMPHHTRPDGREQYDWDPSYRGR